MSGYGIPARKPVKARKENISSAQRNKENVLAQSSNTKIGKDTSTTDPHVNDETPDITHKISKFSKKYFWDKLGNTEVVWSKRMTWKAGMCRYVPARKCCVITLSIPLLSLRPKRDLTDILLHEMIHAYLFITREKNPYHGEAFKMHMNRINKEARTNITIYHPFTKEIEELRQHWWRCNGHCRIYPPYYGYVKRTMNRAPGPNDHKVPCNGQFIKVKEPANYGQKNSHSKKGKATTGTSLQ